MGALILNPTVVPVMWNIYDGIGRFQSASCMRDDTVHFCSTIFRLALHIGQFHGAICVFMDNVNALAWNPTVVPMMVSVLDRMLEKQEGVSVWPILRGGSWAQHVLNGDAEQECAANSTLRHDRYCIDRTAPGNDLISGATPTESCA